MGDMPALQDDITGSIARVLRYELIEAASRRSLRERPANPQAIDCALRAVATAMRDPLVTRENSRTAQRLYEEALRLDPCGCNRANMHGVLGTANLYLGNHDEAIR